MIATIKQKLASESMVSKSRDKGKSNGWSIFNELYENGKKEERFVICKQCSLILYKPTSNTNAMNRHRCYLSSAPNITAHSKSNLKLASASYVAKDLHSCSNSAFK